MAAWSARIAVPPAGGKREAAEPPDHALGRSRGGFSTKIPVVCDGAGAPLNIELSPGQTHETRLFEDLWTTTEVVDPALKPLVQPQALAGDKAYDSGTILRQFQSEAVQPVIPQMGKTVAEQTRPDIDRNLYRRRNVIERLIGWLKESRRVFSRFEKTAINFRGMIHDACIRYYLAELR